MATLEQATPLMAVRDVEASAAFFARIGFRVHESSEIYAFVKRDNAAVRLQKAVGEPGEQACYIDVDDVDALWAELKPMFDAEPDRRVRAPFDQPYGQREFHAIEDSILIFFGQPIQQSP